MKRLKLSILITIIAVFVAATYAAPKIKVTALKKGKVMLTRGSVKSTLDLSKDISGCIVTYDRGDPKHRNMDTTSFSKMDEVVRGGKTYLLLESEINSGCNVSGECGAATDLTLVWLELNDRLKIVKKEAVVVQSCFWGDINFVDEDNSDMKLIKGQLSVTIETNRYKTGLEYSVSTVTYDRAHAEDGLVVKTTKPLRPN